jgi:hypothetical protein
MQAINMPVKPMEANHTGRLARRHLDTILFNE